MEIDIELTPELLIEEVKTYVTELYKKADLSFLKQLFRDVEQIFHSSWKNYQGIDSGYHNLEHTLRATQCMARLMYCYQKNKGKPEIFFDKFVIGLTAILLHDMGFLKEVGDISGTGAKYTFAHQTRSCQFAHKYLHEKDWLSVDVLSVEKLITCTGLRTDVSKISFIDSVDEVLGRAIATADYLGQMSDPRYIKKLYLLFEEFEEAEFFRGLEKEQHTYKTPEELISKTPGFWLHTKKEKLERECEGIYKYLSVPYPDGKNVYIDAVEVNVQRIRAITSK